MCNKPYSCQQILLILLFYFHIFNVHTCSLCTFCTQLLLYIRLQMHSVPSVYIYICLHQYLVTSTLHLLTWYVCVNVWSLNFVEQLYRDNKVCYFILYISQLELQRWRNWQINKIWSIIRTHRIKRACLGDIIGSISSNVMQMCKGLRGNLVG